MNFFFFTLILKYYVMTFKDEMASHSSHSSIYIEPSLYY